MRNCKEEGCEKPVLARGWCGGHYQRNRNHGSPLGGGSSQCRRIKIMDGRPHCIHGPMRGSGHDGWECVEAARIRTTKYRAENRDKVRDYTRKWRENKDREESNRRRKLAKLILLGESESATPAEREIAKRKASAMRARMIHA